MARERGSRTAEAGYAMVIMMVFTSITFLSVSAGYEKLYQLFASEEASERLPALSDGLQEALGYGLARLQTGEPTVGANDRYICNLKLRDSDGALVTYKLTYKKLVNNEWTLRAEPTSGSNQACPAVFTDNACPAPLP